MPRLVVPVLALLLTASLAACSGNDETQVPQPAPLSTFVAGKVPVIMPGAPGEQPTVLQPGQTGTMANAGSYGDADVTFVTSMIPHHAQALEMAALAPDRAQDKRVVALASRIAAGQGPEIQAMQAWLRQQGMAAVDEDAGHGDHGDMPGMASPEDMTRLVAARGVGFDRMFLQLMTQHHQGAVQMANEAVGAVHPIVSEMVDDTVATQSAEITRMQRVMADLPA